MNPSHPHVSMQAVTKTYGPVRAVDGLNLVTLGGALATEAAATRASRLTVREALAYL